MFARRFGLAWLRRVSMLLLAGVAFSQAPPAVQSRPGRYRAPFLNLSDAKSIATRYSGDSALVRSILGSQTRALSSTAGDFDEDGMPDLVSGLATAGGAGAVTVHRGNVDALWPYGALRGTDPPGFLPDARVFALPEAPDFLAAGDFDADGHWDIVAARSGGSALYLLKGDGHGGFADAERIPLPGTVTAMTSGEINRADGLTDLMVAITSGGGARALVFESPLGALHRMDAFRGTPEAFPLPADATALAVMPLDGGIMNGLAVAAGHDLLLIHGRDRKLTRQKADRDGVPQAVVTRQTFPFAVRSLAVGHFTSPTLDLAALGDDGQIHILERSDADEPVWAGEARFSMPGPGGAARSVAPFPRRNSAPRAAGHQPKTTAMAQRSTIGLPLSISRASAAGVKLVTARVAATGRDSLIVLDPAGRQLHVVSHPSRDVESSGAHEATAAMAVSASIDIAGAPAAVQPMRINKDALSDLVVLHSQQAAPIVIETTPSFVFVVTNTDDNLPDGGQGSLRDALGFANALGGNVEIDFNIPVTDPSRDPTTGVFTIQPIGASDIEALPNLGAAITIDGYTQPGASPNTLANGDNAHPLIELNGSMSGSGPSGLQIYSDGCTIRGIVLTNFVQAPIPGVSGQSHGGAGIDIESSGNVIEGNFFGIDAGGTFLKPSYLGIISFGGENGNLIGGTTPQARNIISGNYYAGIGLQQSAVVNSYLIQGNYIGTDKTGTQALPNQVGGVGLEGLNAVLGGTTAGAGNLIASNEDLDATIQMGCSNCLPAQGNLIQGNFIGTDLTGTRTPSTRSGEGVTLDGSTGDTVGGTTPAARNIISGHRGNAVDLFGGNENALVEGNYIGLDVTGTQALGSVNAGVNFGTQYYDLEGHLHSGGPSVNNLIGGESPGAGNVISANGSAGINITSLSGFPGNNVISGNLIGTDATGANPLPNQGDGILMQQYATSNTVGGADPAAANVIAFNTGNGVRIDPGSPNTTTFGASGNSVIGNAIYSNGGAGVRIPTGTGNLVSHNLIYSNGALGIDIDAAGVLVNSNCQANTSGANLLQNAPVLTAGSGATFVTATATDPNGNTSEFSNCVPTSLAGNVLDIAGTFNSTPSTAYTIEYFSNSSCDASGYGQGKVYLGSTTVTTNSSCTASLNNSLDLTKADLSVTNTSGSSPITNMTFLFTSVVANNGPAAATAVVWTDALPAGVNYLAATATQGACNFAGGTLTCNLGNLPVGGIVTISASLVPTALSGTFSNTVAVAATTPDSNTANNTATFTKAITYDPYLNHLSPASVTVGSPNLTLNLVGQGFTSASVVTYGGVTYPATLNTNWNPNDCGVAFFGGANYCTALAITVPAAQLTAVATVPVAVVTTFGGESVNFNIVPATALPGPVTHFVLSGIGNSVTSGSLQLLYITATDANGLTVPTYTGTANLTSTDPAPTVFTAGGGTATVVFTASDAGVADTITALQTVGTQSITATDTSNATITGTLGGIVVANGPASNLALTGSPQATPLSHAFAQPLSVTVTDLYGNPVPNQLVTFTPPASGASAVLSSHTATTNSAGVASVTATANSISGTYQVAVTFGPGVAGGGDNADVFLLNNGAGLATLTATAGTPQSTFTGQLFQTNLQATLLDGMGNPISGATVYFTSGNTNGAAAIVTASAVTNVSGVATATANAPSNASPGTFPVYATAGGLTATFTLTENAPMPVVLTITAGSPQTIAAGFAFTVPLTVKVTDGFGSVRPGVVVTYIPPATGASATLSSGTASTNSSGIASLTATANNTQGTYSVTASVGGVTVDFVLTNGAAPSGTPASIAPTAGTPQSQLVNQAFSTAMQAIVKNAAGVALPGVSVTFTAPLTGASGAFTVSATVTTNGSGIATAPAFTANTVAGTYNVTAKAGSVSTSFLLTNLGGAPASMNIYAGNNQNGSLNTAFSTPLAVQLVDTYGNPAGGSVTFILSPGTSGASGTFTGAASPIASTGVNGIATAPSHTANGTIGSFNVLAFYFSGGAQLYQSFTLTNTTAIPAAISALSGTPQSTSAGTAFATALTAKVTDAGNNPLAGFSVNFTAPSSGAGAALSSPSAITNASGIATVTATANAIGGTYNVTAAIGGHTATFVLQNIAPVNNKCDVNLDGSVTAADAQLMVNEALGLAAAANDLTADGVANTVDVQIVVDAALNLGCSAQ